MLCLKYRLLEMFCKISPLMSKRSVFRFRSYTAPARMQPNHQIRHYVFSYRLTGPYTGFRSTYSTYSLDIRSVCTCKVNELAGNLQPHVILRITGNGRFMLNCRGNRGWITVLLFPENGERRRKDRYVLFVSHSKHFTVFPLLFESRV